MGTLRFVDSLSQVSWNIYKNDKNIQKLTNTKSPPLVPLLCMLTSPSALLPGMQTAVVTRWKLSHAPPTAPPPHAPPLPV